MDEQVFSGKSIQSVETVMNPIKNSVLNPSPAATTCCEVDHSLHDQFADETDLWDKVGIFLSALCAVHCLATPLVALALPVLGEMFEGPWVHLIMAVVILPIGVFAFWSGYRHHKQGKVFALGLVGLLFVAFGSVLPHEMHEMWGHDVITITGSLLLVTAHVLNRRACQCHAHPH